MDPNAALKQMVEAFARGDRECAMDSLYALQDWITEGGFIPQMGAQELMGKLPRILIEAGDVPEGENFCKQHGSYWYRRISQSAADRYLEEEIRSGAVYGVSDSGNMTDLAPTKKVWVRPPNDWKQIEYWVELMQKYLGYDPEEDEVPK